MKVLMVFFIFVAFLNFSYAIGKTQQGFGTQHQYPLKKIYCISEENYVQIEKNKQNLFIETDSNSTPDCIGNLACYKCCVGEAGHSKEICNSNGFNNWMKGKNCNCD